MNASMNDSHNLGEPPNFEPFCPPCLYALSLEDYACAARLGRPFVIEDGKYFNNGKRIYVRRRLMVIAVRIRAEKVRSGLDRFR